MTYCTNGKKLQMAMLLAVLLLVASAVFFTPALYASSTEAVEAANTSSDFTPAIVCLAAALAFGMGAFGAGMAIAKVGSSAMGAISERPEIASNALIFIAMAEGIAVFGFIAALMILGKV